MQRPLTENERKYMMDHPDKCMYWPDYDNKENGDGGIWGEYGEIMKFILIIPLLVAAVMAGIWFLIDGFGIFGMKVGAVILFILLIVPSCISPFIVMGLSSKAKIKKAEKKHLDCIKNDTFNVEEIVIKTVVNQQAEAYFDTEDGESMICYCGARNVFAPKEGEALYIITSERHSIVMKKFES